MKRCLDFVISLLLLLMLAPLLMVVGLLVRIFLGKQVLFTQKRPGLNSKIFKLYKFRTMTEQLESDGSLSPDEVRLTKFGKILRASSIDELPSLLNVIKGDLSLVGPRPLLVEYLPLYNTTQAKRHLVRPGITGWAQVNGRNAISWREKFELDVWYVENQSLLLDFKILLMTLKKVFIKEGISAHGHVTVEPFKGNKSVK
ncbi:sugar transferase [Shewanella sp. 1CM18E]|uniref:sugar transferase n=1 Tax=Shewanella sp. 1CM18E TaxID=2929169 RepID=UPI00249DA46B|nr:sugar transferase [Shewanella sp. 1CM18E]